MMESGTFAGLTLVTAPVAEPVTLGLAKDWLRRGRDDTSEDSTIGAEITAARQQVEDDTGRHLPTQIWNLAINAFPCGREPLPLLVTPLQAVLSVKLYDLNDVETTWASSNYYVDTFGTPGRLCVNSGVSWPRDLRAHVAAVIQVRSGYAAGTAVAVTSVTRSAAVATVTTTTAHGLKTGDVVTLAGAAQAEYNLTVDVTVLSTTQFTFPVSGSPVTPATGTITVTPSGVPGWATMAMRLRLAAFNEFREMSAAEQRLYRWLVDPNRVVTFA